MQELPPGANGHLTERQPGPGSVDRRRSGELVEFDPIVARRNRRWMALVLFPALIVGVVALVATLDANHGSPSVTAAQVPVGYKSVTDGYFGYAVPTSWTQNLAYTDDVGDSDMSGSTGWAGEHVAVRATAPAASEPAPSSLAAFGEARALPYQLSRAQPTSVAGAATAFRYQMTRPGGFQATVIDAWQSQSGGQIWLVIKADPATTATIVASLKG